MNGNSTAIYYYNGRQADSDVFDKSSGTRFYENGFRSFITVKTDFVLGKKYESLD